MMGILKRFEDAQMEGEEALEQLRKHEEEDEPEDELVAALHDIDLGESSHGVIVSLGEKTDTRTDSIGSNELLRLIPQDHRDAFLAAIRNPDSESARVLLERAVADEAGSPDAMPWWEGSDLSEDIEDGQLVRGAPPQELPDDLVKSISPPEGTGSKLVYNVLATW